METIFSWYFLICVFPGGIIGFLVALAYEDYTDTDHWFGMFYWPILLLLLIIKHITDKHGTDISIPDDYWP